jgi:hypothetical protein
MMFHKVWKRYYKSRATTRQSLHNIEQDRIERYHDLHTPGFRAGIDFGNPLGMGLPRGEGAAGVPSALCLLAGLVRAPLLAK